MPRIAYVNGRYVAHADAAVHIEDRGYQFADGVYEVCEVARGFIVDMPRHLGRLGRSLSELSIAWPVSRGVMPLLMREVVRRNHVTTGLVYLQVTRGVASRDFLFPPAGTPSSLVITARKADPAAQAHGPDRARNFHEQAADPDDAAVDRQPVDAVDGRGQGGKTFRAV